MTLKIEEKDGSIPDLQPVRKSASGKDAAIGLRTENHIKLAAMRAAAAERRSVSSLCEKLIVEFLVSEGYLSPEDAKMELGDRKPETGSEDSN